MFEGSEQSHSDELLIIIEAVADTQETANTICSFARSTMLHFGYEGRISTAGNLAFPFSPSDCKVDDPLSLFARCYERCNSGVSNC